MTWLPKQMPLGQECFSVLREGGKYYVDKTALIDDVMQQGEGTVLLYTRPRRFGKTLNMSMLDAYFNEEHKGNAWFDGLRISDLRPDDPEKNSNVVVSLTMKDLESDSLDDVVQSMQKKIAEQLDRVVDRNDLLDRGPRLRNMYDDLMEMGAPKRIVRSSLRDVCELVYRCYGKKTIVLIDEYDNMMNKMHGKQIHEEVVDFMSVFYSSALKTNPYLKFAVLTGVMQIPKESICSGLNNIIVDDVFSDGCDEASGDAFGFTPEEVRKLCEDMGAPEKFEEAKLWYDGYRFGSAEMYNPWSIMGYAKNGFQADIYWINTSRNNILDDVLQRADEDTYGELGELLSGKHLVKLLDRNVTFGELYKGSAALYSIMVMSGYLTAVRYGDVYEVSIPNTEISKVFGRKLMSDIGGEENPELSCLNQAVKAGDVDTVSKALTKLLEVLSVRMLKSEHAYQAYLAGLFVASREKHAVTTDREREDGYCDLMLTSTKRSGADVLMELKRCKGNESPEKTAEEALEQIIDKRYTAGTDRTVMAYGVAFKSEKATVTFRRIEPERAGRTGAHVEENR